MAGLFYFFYFISFFVDYYLKKKHLVLPFSSYLSVLFSQTELTFWSFANCAHYGEMAMGVNIMLTNSVWKSRKKKNPSWITRLVSPIIIMNEDIYYRIVAVVGLSSATGNETELHKWWWIETSICWIAIDGARVVVSHLWKSVSKLKRNCSKAIWAFKNRRLEIPSFLSWFEIISKMSFMFLFTYFFSICYWNYATETEILEEMKEHSRFILKHLNVPQ